MDTMTLTFRCDICHYERSLSAEYDAKKIRCPQCAAVNLVVASTLSSRKIKPCPFCGEEIFEEAKKCRFCNEIVDRALAIAKDKQKIREVQRAKQIMYRYLPASRPSLIIGIVSLLLFPAAFVLGPIAILMGFHSLRESKSNPQLEGIRFAKAGIMLGIVSMGGLALFLALNIKLAP